MYLSYDILLQLGVLAQTFPRLESTGDKAAGQLAINIVREINQGCDAPPGTTCSCPLLISVILIIGLQTFAAWTTQYCINGFF